MVTTDLHVEGTDALLAAGLERTDGELFLINPTQEGIQELVEVLSEIQYGPPIRLFADEEPLKEVLDDFLIASRMADLVVTDRLEVRTLREVPRTFLLLTRDAVMAVVDGGSCVSGLTSTEETLVTSTYETYEGQWKRADPYSIRTPPLTRVRETLAEEIGEEVVGDMNGVLEMLETARGGGDGLDEVTIALLVAARHNVLLYDISRWGEDVQLASKATFSRTKNLLEDRGLIATEKVPIEVGRPRLRLVLGNSELEDAPLEELVAYAQAELT